MKATLNLLLLIVSIAAVTGWIIALCKWDGKCPCQPEDCENCPYSGTGCETEKTHKQRKDETS